MRSGETMLSHEGVVVKVENGRYDVVIESNTACEGCKAQAYCGVSGVEESHERGSDGKEMRGKIISVNDPHIEGIAVGDRVVVSVRRKVATFATFFAYVLPLILFVSTIVGMVNIVESEGLAALAAFGVVAVYYMVVYCARLYFERMVNFEIKKLR